MRTDPISCYCLCVCQDVLKVEASYLDGGEVTGRMRAILIDWLVQVHVRFHLLQETLYLTIDIIDRFLQVRQVQPRGHRHKIWEYSQGFCHTIFLKMKEI